MTIMLKLDSRQTNLTKDDLSDSPVSGGVGAVLKRGAQNDQWGIQTKRSERAHTEQVQRLINQQ